MRDNALVVVGVGNEGLKTLERAWYALSQQSRTAQAFPVWLAFSETGHWSLFPITDEAPNPIQLTDVSPEIRSRVDTDLRRLDVLIVASISDLNRLSPTGAAEQELLDWIQGFDCDFSFTPVMLVTSKLKREERIRVANLADLLLERASGRSRAYLLTGQSAGTAVLIDHEDLLDAASVFIEALASLLYHVPHASDVIEVIRAPPVAFSGGSEGSPIFGSAAAYKVAMPVGSELPELLERIWPIVGELLGDSREASEVVELSEPSEPSFNYSPRPVQLGWCPRLFSDTTERIESFQQHREQLEQALESRRAGEVAALDESLSLIYETGRASELSSRRSILSTEQEIWASPSNTGKVGRLRDFYQRQIGWIDSAR